MIICARMESEKEADEKKQGRDCNTKEQLVLVRRGEDKESKWREEN